MPGHDTQSFFTPEEFSCQRSLILADTYNLAHVLLNRAQTSFLFVPIRTMQYLAIIEQNAFWFVDSMAYAVRDKEGGRLITVSWHPLTQAQERDSLGQHMDCSVIYYDRDMNDVQVRLQKEFHQAMQLLDQRYRETIVSSGKVNILPLKLPEE